MSCSWHKAAYLASAWALTFIHIGLGDVGDANDRPPLREAGAELPIFFQSLPQAVQAFGYLFVRRSGQRFRPGVDLDAGQNALLGEHVGERRSTRALLPDGLVIQDRAADKGSSARRRKKHFAIGTAAVISGSNLQSVESLGQGRHRLVNCQNALSFGSMASLTHALFHRGIGGRACIGCQLLTHPGSDQHVGHGEHHRPDEDAHQAERNQPTEDSRQD